MSGKKKKPYLGPLLLAWCDRCNVPLVKREHCGLCGEKTRRVPVTPPGDARPAFKADRDKIISSIALTYGDRVAHQLLPSDKIVLLNAIPDIDCCEEIIVDGRIIGLHRFRIETLSWEFVPKMEGARRLVKLTNAKQVVIDDSAVPFILKGANLLRPGITRADSSIRQEEYVIGITQNKDAILVGTATMKGEDMQTRERGMAIKKKYKAEPQEPKLLPGGQTWNTVLEANANILRSIETEALEFINQVAEDSNLPLVVAFSGGKDSLVVLLLVRKALPNHPYHLIFINTGIEFPETIQNVYTTAANYNLENQLLVKNVDENQFFRVMDLYGFMARDYRVCCKTVKLGPTSQIIEQYFPDGCLSFIGQRRYESHRRSASKRIWQNPWVPKQVGASPIHNWTAMMIWLYIFHEKATYNPLYEKGFERIGCMFCPASTMSELKIIAENFPSEWQRWQSNAKKLVQRYGMSTKWLEHGFWRWKKHPPKIRELAQRMDINLLSEVSDQTEETPSFIIDPENVHEFKLIKGRITKPIGLNRAAAFLPALGTVIVDIERRLIEVTIQTKKEAIKAILFESGLFSLAGPVTQKIAKKFARTVLRGVLCTGCGTCQSLCENDAISIDKNQANILAEKCIRCENCLHGKCPSLYAN